MIKHLCCGLTVAMFASMMACNGCGDDPVTRNNTQSDALSDVSEVGVADTAPPTDGGRDFGPDSSADATADLDMPTDLCGNGVIDDGEACDGDEFGAASCVSRGFTSGELRCSATCEVVDARCDLCGDGTCGMSETATACAAECAAVSVAAGYTHTCAVRTDGSVWCWGAHDGHQAGGMGDVSTPHPISGVTGATSVAVGEAHTCVVHGAGEVSCWGRNGFGELGSGELNRVRSVPQPVTLPAPAVQLALGRHHSCAVLDTGSVSCWGRGDHGELGHGAFELRNPVPQNTTGTGYGFATAGEHHTCGANAANGLCWGWNEQGQIGLLNRAWTSTPTTVAGFMQALGSGDRHTCAYIFNLGAPPQFSGLFCWGSNGYGQLGAPPSPDVLGPQRIFVGYTQVEGGATFTCALFGPAPTVAHCWGRNDFGQLGDGTVELRYEPETVLSFGNAVQLTGGQDHACARLDSGELRCWGRNQHGQVGGLAAEPFYSTPIAPEGF